MVGKPSPLLHHVLECRWCWNLPAPLSQRKAAPLWAWLMAAGLSDTYRASSLAWAGERCSLRLIFSGFLMWSILQWATSSPLQPNWLLAKEAVNWRTKPFFPKWWGHLVPSHTFLQRQCHKTSNLFIRKQNLEGHALEILIFLFLCGISKYSDATLALY